MVLKKVFTVKYKNQSCKTYAIGVLNAIDGVFAENDKNAGSLLRDVTVTVTRNRDLETTKKILKLLGSNVHKKSVFKVKFSNDNTRMDAVNEVKRLDGVVKAEYDTMDSGHSMYRGAPSTINVLGDVDPTIVLRTLQKYGTAEISS